VSPEITIRKHLSSIIYEEQHLPIQLDTKLMITNRSHHGREREVNHIATGKALSPEGDYSLLIMGDSNVDVDGGEVDGDGGGVNGDGSGGTSPSQQGAGTETSIPRNCSSTVAALQNFIWENAD
jgi:hypothetical protein